MSESLDGQVQVCKWHQFFLGSNKKNGRSQNDTIYRYRNHLFVKDVNRLSPQNFDRYFWLQLHQNVSITSQARSRPRPRS